MTDADRLARAWGKFAKPDLSSSAEKYFFDNEDRRGVSDLADPTKAAPPTTDEILKRPGGEEFSTLNRYIVDTAQPNTKGTPESREELPNVHKEAGSSAYMVFLQGVISDIEDDSGYGYLGELAPRAARGEVGDQLQEYESDVAVAFAARQRDRLINKALGL